MSRMNFIILISLNYVNRSVVGHITVFAQWSTHAFGQLGCMHWKPLLFHYIAKSYRMHAARLILYWPCIMNKICSRNVAWAVHVHFTVLCIKIIKFPSRWEYLAPWMVIVVVIVGHPVFAVAFIILLLYLSLCALVFPTKSPLSITWYNIVIVIHMTDNVFVVHAYMNIGSCHQKRMLPYQIYEKQKNKPFPAPIQTGVCQKIAAPHSRLKDCDSSCNHRPCSHMHKQSHGQHTFWNKYRLILQTHK